MTTNAMLLDKYMSYLEKHKVNLLISLDGNQVHNSYRIDKQGNPSLIKYFIIVQEHHLQLQIKMLMTTMVIPLLVPMKSCVYAETVAEIQLHRIYNA